MHVVITFSTEVEWTNLGHRFRDLEAVLPEKHKRRAA
jgi:hypothetical protein